MAKEAEKEAAKEAKKAADLDREAKKLRSFLEDYDDDRDDPKYYKGRELDRRLHDREREAAKDAEDRAKAAGCGLFQLTMNTTICLLRRRLSNKFKRVETMKLSYLWAFSILH